MRLWLCLAILASAPAAAAAEPDAAKLAQARSLMAEAVSLDRAEAGGRVTRIYAQSLREDLVDDLAKLKHDPALGPVAAEAIADLARGDTAALARLRDRLVAQERSHGRAD